jgi:hypothetical protein
MQMHIFQWLEAVSGPPSVVVVGETGDKVIILGIAGQNGSSRNGQESHALDAEVVHAVGAMSSMCCSGGWFDKPSCTPPII